MACTQCGPAMRSPVRRLWLPLVAAASLSVGCLGAPDATDDDGLDPGEPTSVDALSDAKCDDASAALFFHGMHGFGRNLGGQGVCAPKMANTGPTGFWSDVAFVAAPASKVVAGYSAGRIPMLRRLARVNDEGMSATETTAVMLDGSWADGPRFDGATGPSIVEAWLAGDPSRRFVLVYLRSSQGWKEYAALADGPLADRVTTCEARGTHADLPTLVGRNLVRDPAGWLAQRCPDGKLK